MEIGVAYECDWKSRNIFKSLRGFVYTYHIDTIKDNKNFKYDKFTFYNEDTNKEIPQQMIKERITKILTLEEELEKLYNFE